MRYVHQDFKVFTGPVKYLRKRGTSNCMVSCITLLYFNVDQVRHNPVGIVCVCGAPSCFDSLGHASRLGPSIQPLIGFRHHSYRIHGSFSFPGVR